MCLKMKEINVNASGNFVNHCNAVFSTYEILLTLNDYFFLYRFNELHYYII